MYRVTTAGRENFSPAPLREFCRFPAPAYIPVTVMAPTIAKTTHGLAVFEINGAIFPYGGQSGAGRWMVIQKMWAGIILGMNKAARGVGRLDAQRIRAALPCPFQKHFQTGMLQLDVRLWSRQVHRAESRLDAPHFLADAGRAAP